MSACVPTQKHLPRSERRWKRVRFPTASGGEDSTKNSVGQNEKSTAKTATALASQECLTTIRPQVTSTPHIGKLTENTTKHESLRAATAGIACCSQVSCVYLSASRSHRMHSTLACLPSVLDVVVAAARQSLGDLGPLVSVFRLLASENYLLADERARLVARCVLRHMRCCCFHVVLSIAFWAWDRSRLQVWYTLAPIASGIQVPIRVQKKTQAIAEGRHHRIAATRQYTQPSVTPSPARRLAHRTR